jgi:hypothetical protein
MIKKLTVKETCRERNEVEERKANIGIACKALADVMCEELWGVYGLHYAGMFIYF